MTTYFRFLPEFVPFPIHSLELKIIPGSIAQLAPISQSCKRDHLASAGTNRKKFLQSRRFPHINTLIWRLVLYCCMCVICLGCLKHICFTSIVLQVESLLSEICDTTSIAEFELKVSSLSWFFNYVICFSYILIYL